MKHILEDGMESERKTTHGYCMTRMGTVRFALEQLNVLDEDSQLTITIKLGRFEGFFVTGAISSLSEDTPTPSYCTAPVGTLQGALGSSSQ